MSWRLPAEWEPQEALWLVWPRDETTWPDGRIEGARQAMVEVVRNVAPAQAVHLLVHPGLEGDAAKALGGIGGVRLWPVEHTDSWIRDYGPLTVVDDAGGRRPLDFAFDAWGGKYESLAQDDGVTGRLAAAGAWPAAPERIGTVLEGGAIDTDGQGTFLCTESVPRHRGQTPVEIEALLHDPLGAAKVLWLDGGIQGDDTDGHVDTVTRFVAPRVVVTAVQQDMEDPDHRPLLVNRERLHTMTDALGRPLAVQDLPMPDPVYTDDDRRLPASHANFLITNDCVLMPAYGGSSDDVAHDILQAVLPTRRVVPIPHGDLIWGMGGIHCLSMTIPAP